MTTRNPHQTILTGCGWGAKGNHREAKGKLKLHMKVCDICKGIDLSQFTKESGFAKMNGFDRITVSRNGNLAKAQQRKFDVVGSSNATTVISNIHDIETILDAVKTEL